MTGGLPNKPRILRGAFVEYGISLPPLAVVFQFNPLQLTRNRTLTHTVLESTAADLRKFHQMEFDDRDDLLAIQEQQTVEIKEETIGFDIRLDATDKLNERNVIAQEFGIAPQLSTLGSMVLPKGESLLGGAVDKLLGNTEKGFSFTKKPNPPMILFIWGRKRVLPVNINSMNITETEFSSDLNPIRATVAVSLTVIEGKSVPYLYSKGMMEAMSALNLANITDIANVVIPG